MDDLRTILQEQSLESLRSSYDHDTMVDAIHGAAFRPYPPIAEWNQGIAGLLYRQTDPLAAANRERCLIAVLNFSGQSVPLAIHIYWGLMEGLSVSEICHIIALTACYGGVPKLVPGFLSIERVLTLLQGLADSRQTGVTQVLPAIVAAFSDPARG